MTALGQKGRHDAPDGSGTNDGKRLGFEFCFAIHCGPPFGMTNEY